MQQERNKSPVRLFNSLWKQRQLIWLMTKRDVVGRYRGSFGGLLWSVASPLLMLGVYTLVFGAVLKIRWGTDQDTNQVEYALVLFAGLIMFNILAECVTRAPNLVVENVSFVKKVLFPIALAGSQLDTDNINSEVHLHSISL